MTLKKWKKSYYKLITQNCLKQTILKIKLTDDGARRFYAPLANLQNLYRLQEKTLAARKEFNISFFLHWKSDDVLIYTWHAR